MTPGDDITHAQIAERFERRARKAEAQLARVRAWAEFFTPESVGEAELWAILDGEPSPTEEEALAGGLWVDDLVALWKASAELSRRCGAEQNALLIEECVCQLLARAREQP